MRRFAYENLPVTLSLSLHAPNDEIRRQTMPVAKKYGMDEVLAAQKDESRTWPWFRMRQLRILEDYYENGLWRLDFETDERGLLPRGLKRGVLSEDALWDVLRDWDELRKK